MPHGKGWAVNGVKIRLARNSDGPRIGELVRQNSFDIDVDWSEVEPYWLVVEDETRVVGAAQIAPGKPIGRLEMLAVDPSLEGFSRGRVVSKLLRQGCATLKIGGSKLVMGSVPFALKSYKRVLKKHGAFVASSGNLIARKLT